MKSVKINGVNVKVFEKRELTEKLRLSDEEIKLVMDYQKTFPELLQDGVEGFVIDARNLWTQLGNPQGDFSHWIKRKMIDKGFIINTDYSSFDKSVEREVGGSSSKEYLLTIETAKHVSMMENSDKGKLIRKYFITMEKTLRNYEKWIEIREPQKAGNNEMKHLLNEEYLKTHKVTSSPIYVFSNDNDMLNMSLLGKKAKDVRELLDYEDKITREHFTSDINKALSELQTINSSLIISKMDFDSRKSIIQRTCNVKYSHIKDEFNSYVKSLKSLTV